MKTRVFLIIIILIILCNPLSAQEDRRITRDPEIASLKTIQEKLEYCLRHFHEDFDKESSDFTNLLFPVPVDTLLAELVWIGKPAIPRLFNLLRDDTPAGDICNGCPKATVAKRADWVLRIMTEEHMSYKPWSHGSLYQDTPEERAKYIKQWQDWWEKNKNRDFESPHKPKKEPFQVWLDRIYDADVIPMENK